MTTEMPAPPSARGRPGSALPISLLLPAGAVFLWLVSFRGTVPIWRFMMGEGGLWLDEAVRVLDGEVMYADFFEFVGPGVVYLNALVFGILGPTTVAAALIPILIAVLMVLLMLRLSFRYLEGAWRFVPPFLLLFVVYPSYSPGNHKWPMFLFMLACLDLLSMGNLSAGRVLLAGAAGGMAILCTQDIGAAFTAGVMLALWPRTDGTHRLAFLSGVFMMLSTVLGYFAYHAGAMRLWYDLVVFPLTSYRGANPMGFSLFAAGVAGPTAWHLPRPFLLWLIPLAAFAASVLLMLPGARRSVMLKERLGSWAYILYPGLAVLVGGTLGRHVEPLQLSVRSLLLIPAGTLLLQSLSLLRPRLLRPVIVILVVMTVYFPVTTVAARQLRPLTLVESRAGKAWVSIETDGLEWLQESTAEGEGVFAFPDLGGFYFLTRTRNVTSFPYVQGLGFTPAAQLATAIEEIRTARPRVGIFDASRAYGGPPMERSTLAPLYLHLMEHYDVTDRKLLSLKTRDESR